MSTVQFDGDMSEEFGAKSGVKQGCVLAPTLFGIFFTLLLKHAFKSSTDSIYLHTRSDGRLFNVAWLRSKTNIRSVTIRDLLFADDAAIGRASKTACHLFSLTSQKKTRIMGQNITIPPSITLNVEKLEVVHQFQYLASTATNNHSLDVEISKCIGKASTTFSTLIKNVCGKTNISRLQPK